MSSALQKHLNNDLPFRLVCDDHIDGHLSMQRLESRIEYAAQISTILCAHLPSSFVLSNTLQKRTYFTVDQDSEANAKHAHILIKDKDGTLGLLLIHHQMPPQPTPSCFFQVAHYGVPPPLPDGECSKSRLGKLVHLVLDWQTPDADVLLTSDATPIPIADLLAPQSMWKYPTDTQLTNLVVRLCKEIDALPKTIFFWISLQSVFILDPKKSGGDRPLEYKLCPSHLFMTANEKPASHSREELVMYAMSKFCLQLATRLADIFVPHLQKHVIIAKTRYPGIMEMCSELFINSRPLLEVGDMTSQAYLKLAQLLGPLTEMFAQAHPDVADLIDRTMPPQYPSPKLPEINLLFPPTTQNLSLVEASRTLKVMSCIDTRRVYTIEDLPGLIQLVQCVDSIRWHTPAIEAIWSMLLGSTKKNLGLMIGILAECVQSLVPSGTASLTAPSSSEKSGPWILRMNVIDRLLFELERSGDYSRLRQTQQKLLEAGIYNHLVPCLNQFKDAKFSYKVLMPIVRTSIQMSFQFPTILRRLIYDTNVVRMASLMIEACREPRKDIHPTDTQRLICMLLVMSDFWSWCNDARWRDAKNHPVSVQRVLDQLPSIWTSCDPDIFLFYVLPCWTANLSDATTAAIVCKLEAHCTSIVKKISQSKDAFASADAIVLKKRLTCILQWLNNFAWRAPTQVSSHSVQSLYTAYFQGMIFCDIRPFIILDVIPSRRRPLLLSVDRDAEATDTAKVHQMRHAWVLDCNLSSTVTHEADSVKNLSATLATHPMVHSSTGKMFCNNDFEVESFDDPLPVLQPPDADKQDCDKRLQKYAGQLGLTSTQIQSLHVQFFEPLSSVQVMKASLIDLESRFMSANPEALPWSLRQPKMPLTIRTLLGFVRQHKYSSVMHHFVPRPQHHGAPSTLDHVHLELPLDKSCLDVAYYGPVPETSAVAPPDGHAPITNTTLEPNYHHVRTLSEREAVERSITPKEFLPITLAARHRLCHTKHVSHTSSMPGTTGMCEVHVVDGGATNNLTIGITWDLSRDQAVLVSGQKKPGRSPTSIGLDIDTGHVYYQTPDGAQFKLPYVFPMGTGSRIRIGIAHRHVYFVVDETFFSPLPNIFNGVATGEDEFFTIPENANVHMLVHFGCRGARVATRAMIDRWSLEVDAHGMLKDTASNPLAYALHLAQLRMRVCPHFHAQRATPESRPTLANLDRDSKDYQALDLEHKNLIDMIQMSHQTCGMENCALFAHRQNLVNQLVENSKSLVVQQIQPAPSDTIPSRPNI